MSQFFIGGRGSDFKPKCPIFVCPKVPREGGCQARMGQYPIFLFFFFKASLTQFILNMDMFFLKDNNQLTKEYVMAMHKMGLDIYL